MARFIALMLCLAAALPAIANNAIVFQKDTLEITRLTPVVTTDEQDEDTQTKTPPAEEPEADAEKAPEATLLPPLEVNVELRGEQALQGEWMQLSGLFSNNNTVMIVFNEAGNQPITRRNVFIETDILLVDQEGIISKILPQIKLSELASDIYPEKPVRAWLYAKGGFAAQNTIAPGDTIKHSLFSPSPLILQ